MGTGTAKEGKKLYLRDAFKDPNAFAAKWKLSGDDAYRLRSVGKEGLEGVEDVEALATDFGLSEAGRKALLAARDAEDAALLPPAPPPPPDLTDEVLQKARMQEGRKTRSMQGLSSTFLTGKTKVGQ